jgi:hypothetical protein
MRVSRVFIDVLLVGLYQTGGILQDDKILGVVFLAFFVKLNDPVMTLVSSITMTFE